MVGVGLEARPTSEIVRAPSFSMLLTTAKRPKIERVGVVGPALRLWRELTKSDDHENEVGHLAHPRNWRPPERRSASGRERQYDDVIIA